MTHSKMKIGVVGAGAMGAGIAQVALANGHAVALADSSAAALERGRAAIAKAFDRDVEKGRLTTAVRDDHLARLALVDTSTGFESFGDCGLVIEAIVERLDAKQQLMRALEAVVAPDAVLATNTSSLSIASIAGACKEPARVLGVHFFNPAPVMPLVEIVPGVRTERALVASVRAMVDGWGKTTVLASDTPGFIVNRIARPFYSEALRIVDEGMASMRTVDWAMRELAGFRMGPFELMDFIGHDVNYVVTESVWTAMYFDPRYKPSITQKRLLESGLLGRKSGRGFYDYAADAVADEPVKDATLGDAIVRRVLAMLVNEAVDAVYWRVASAGDIEVAMTKGVNYPRGLLAWSNALGPASVLAELERLQGETGEDRYRPSPLLRQCVREGKALPT